MSLLPLDRIRGCLLGGAIGDALGAPTEFMSLAAIEEHFGPDGVTGFEPVYGLPSAITDDTQMTLFTAEGLVEAAATGENPCLSVWSAYRRWHRTQLVGSPADETGLAARPEMWAPRAPGMTCIGAIAGGVPGLREEPLNTSKGCGGVMRVAPVGLVADSPSEAYELGCDTAALTHGHPGGWVPAGAMAVMVRVAMDGADLESAITTGRDFARSDPEGHETADWIDRAIALASEGPVDGRRIDGFGAGWVGDEALAIAVACVWRTSDPNLSLLRAVNHSGDTDSTGSLAGHLLGAVHGPDVFRPDWLAEVELREIIEEIVAGLHDSIS